MANRKLLDKLYKSLEEVPDDADVTAVIGLIAYKGEQDDQLPTVQAYGGRAHDLACVVADLITSLSIELPEFNQQLAHYLEQHAEAAQAEIANSHTLH
jgi:hypothetical protein